MYSLRPTFSSIAKSKSRTHSLFKRIIFTSLFN
nr:MAG TPA: hypothetical protein [Caudoviricetes sp.]